jgi:hypothetical protein
VVAAFAVHHLHGEGKRALLPARVTWAEGDLAVVSADR